MADLSFTVEQLAGMENVALVKINGAIDARTVVLFQDKLDELQNQKFNRFILDMEGIKYVNSTGLGTLVNMADALEHRGGGITLIKIHQKVKVVFDMLGLNAFFKIFSTEKDALEYFKEKGATRKASNKPLESVPASVKGTLPSPPPENSRATPPMESSGSTITSITEDEGRIPGGLVEISIPVPSEPGVPFSLVCVVCKVKLNIPRPGGFKCPRCATFFKLFDDGKVIFSERKKASPLQMKLCCTDECTLGLSAFISALANRIGFNPNDVNAITDSITETCNAIVEKAYENKQYLSYNVVINPSSVDLKIQISDFGNFIYDDSVHFSKAMKTMDEFEHKKHPKGGNVINMVKKMK